MMSPLIAKLQNQVGAIFKPNNRDAGILPPSEDTWGESGEAIVFYKT